MAATDCTVVCVLIEKLASLLGRSEQSGQRACCGSKRMGSHFGVGAPPILVYFSGDWVVHWGYGVLTHGHIFV